ncbi:MAG: acyl-protein synthetase [Sorangiineae bacterium]|nr:acyl-protein synthetase [Polyangiaceae bacterium]MEB2323160.1 acyl-protein synthetase [Sorangiineae bacterium]
MSDTDALISESDALHARVRAFARGEASESESFEVLAVELARFQARYSPGFRRLVDARSAGLDRVASIPAVPSDTFRLARVAVHPPGLDAVRFVTSGTTSDARGVHAMRVTDTYRELALRSGARALTEDGAARRVVVALAPPPGESVTSSLGFMMRAFMEDLDGRALTVDPAGACFDANATGRWLASSSGVDVSGLRRAALIANERQEPLLVLGTSLSLVLMLDALQGARIPAPRRTTIMNTGGFKGRRREVSPAKLRRAVARAFRVTEDRVIGEYGMTELTSQLYEVEHGLYEPPAWLRVEPVDPVTLKPVPEGSEGLARFIDLGNVDSAVAIVVQDLVRRRERGIELLGRRPGAPARGCSLAIEALVAGHG